MRRWRFSDFGWSPGSDSELPRELERLSARALDPQVARQLMPWPEPVSLGVPLPLLAFSLSSQLYLSLDRNGPCISFVQNEHYDPTVYSYGLWAGRNRYQLRELPSLPYSLFTILVCMLSHDAWFYYGHRYC